MSHSSSQARSSAVSTRRGLPDLKFIKVRVPIADVARALGVQVVGNSAHCWRPGHQNGDRSPSIWFSKRSNRGQCHVCNRNTWSNVDLVQLHLACTTAEAILWVAARFSVPTIERRHLSNKRPTLSPVGYGSNLEQLIRSGLWATLSGPEAKLLVTLTEFPGKLSYSTLQMLSGVARSSIPPALDRFRQMGLLRVKRANKTDALPGSSEYQLTWDDPGLQRLMSETYATTSREAEAQKELREAERSERRAALHTKVIPSVRPDYQ